MTPLPGESGALWYDDEAGPMVRAYTVTRGRTRPASGSPYLDLIATVTAVESDPPGRAAPPAADPGPGSDVLDDEHLALLDLCRARGPLTVADVAVGADLPLGVVRVLLGDLIAAGRLRVAHPVSPAELPDTGLLRDIISGLRAL